MNITFFGSSKFSVFCLEALRASNLIPTLIVTTPDQPTGRGLKLTPNQVKIWAEENKIACITPDKLNIEITGDVFLVASYGKIIPKSILDQPKFGVLNIHPSLLPKYRGPSPLQEQIINNEQNFGVSLMKLDEKMDHGPIFAQEKIQIIQWPKLEELKKICAKVGVKLFIETLPKIESGTAKATEQNHTQATFTKKIQKVDGLIDLENGDPFTNFRKIQAYSMWPNAYFFVGKTRVIVKDADYENSTLLIKRVLPEGKKEMDYQDFLRGLK